MQQIKKIDAMVLLLETQPSGNCEFEDPICPNLIVRFSDAGPPKYLCKVERNGHCLEAVIGECADWTLDKARSWVKAWNDLVVPGSTQTNVKGLSDASITIYAFFNDHYLPYSRLHHKSVTGNLSLFKQHINPKFGASVMSEISKADVRAWTTDLKSDGYSNAMINRILILFGHLYTVANALDIPDIPERKDLAIKLLKDKQRHHSLLSSKQIEALLLEISKSNNEHLQFIIPFLLYTGARKREALDARWRDINLEQRQWTVPVTKSGRPRIIYLSEKCVGLLTKIQKTDLSIEQSEFLFPNPRTELPYRCIFHAWNKARNAVDLPELRIHDLRHAYASKLVNKGVPLYDVQALLGHTSIKTTQRYAHLSRDRLLASTNQLDY